MADLKEETTVDNNEQNQVEETVETKRPIDPSLQGIQLFYEQNKKMVTYLGGGLLVLIGAFCFFKLYYLPEQEKEAVNEIFWAENLFQRDSFNMAVKGGAMVMSADGQKQMKGFEQIAEEYSMTKTGSLANYYAGICYLRTGNFEKAIEFLGKYDGNDATIAPIAIGAIGDCNMELNRIDEAVKYYSKAANKSENGFTSPLYLKKAGFANELNGNFSEALNNYERIRKEFPKSAEAQDIDKNIAKVKAEGNL
ncbi:tetratricopeptide repeat protein [Aurantibacillus circumpalustris]|uniref:tetratricopeptide repeat protein n=1 Tax=Aurantibacillus circumpalustris TaxID=3036359 RepID=UPI00295B2705|nr:tetratricopeptide repeat protein [Aurantibacillus circumpalustris]